MPNKVGRPSKNNEGKKTLIEILDYLEETGDIDTIKDITKGAYICYPKKYERKLNKCEKPENIEIVNKLREEGKTYVQISAETGLNTNTIRKILNN